MIILGAGASKSYDNSKTGLKMPVSEDFFEIYRKLEISKNPWVLVGNLINYISERDSVDYLEFLNFSEDIEKLHSEIQEKLYKVLKSGKFFSSKNGFTLLKAFNELIFLFTNVLNEIQNGEISNSHLNLAGQLKPIDSIITLNWDILMDRALKDKTNWEIDQGYCIEPNKIFRNKWVKPEKNSADQNFPKLLKLHGSTNWLTSHIKPGSDGNLELIQETSAENFYAFEYATKPYSTFAGRYMGGYEEFSYGYYPPNLPLKGKGASDGYLYVKTRPINHLVPEGNSGDDGLVSMPLIIPPVKDKEYNLFGNLFSQIWEEAKCELEQAEKIYIIGYSFPKTDIRVDRLFKSAFINRKSIPEIIIVNPKPATIGEKFTFEYGIPKDKIKIYENYFDEDFKL